MAFEPVHCNPPQPLMKITPIEIRQKGFEKVFRGYDREEVDAFVQTLSQEWERVIDENKEYRIKLDMAEKEVKKLREVESSLYRTLKTAEDTGTHLIEQANKSAAMQMKEAQVKADSMLREARSKAQQMVQEADSKARQSLEETLSELKLLEVDCRNIENHRDNLLLELRGIVNDMLERVNRIDAKSHRISFEYKVNQVKNLLEQRQKPPTYLAESYAFNQPENHQSETDTRPENHVTDATDASASNNSFFDEIH